MNETPRDSYVITTSRNNKVMGIRGGAANMFWKRRGRGGSSLGVYIVLVQLSVKTPGMLHMGSLLIIGIMRIHLYKNVEVGIVNSA